MSPTLVCSNCRQTVHPRDVKYKVGVRGSEMDLAEAQEMVKGGVKKMVKSAKRN